MKMDRKHPDEALREVEVIGNENNEPVSIRMGYVEGLRCIGIGTDAAVFIMPALRPTHSKCILKRL